MRVLDQLLDAQNPDNFIEENDPEGLDDADADLQDYDAGAVGFVNYIWHEHPESNPDPAPESGLAPHTKTL